jgi:hypothetical protein
VFPDQLLFEAGNLATRVEFFDFARMALGMAKTLLAKELVGRNLGALECREHAAAVLPQHGTLAARRFPATLLPLPSPDHASAVACLTF